MKLQGFMIVALLVPAGAWAQAGESKEPKRKPPVTKNTAPAKSSPQKPSTVTGAAAVPPGAVEVEPNLWRHIDEKGEVWMIRRTPFGIARFRPEAETRNPDEEEAQHLKVTDKGDTVEFERKTPFGVSKWTRKKAELAGAEKIAWERSSQGKAPAPAAKPAQE
jgi:hypothetical protein